MASNRLCSLLDSTKPRLWQLITVKLLIILSQDSFSARAFEMQFEEVDSMQEPTNVDVLLPGPDEDGLLPMISVSLFLRNIEMRDGGIASVRMQG